MQVLKVHLCLFILFQESRESQVSSAAAASDEQGQGPLFSDRTDQTDKTITRYHPSINEDLGKVDKGIGF